VSEYYHDDPVDFSEPKSKKFPGFVAFLLFIFAGGSFLQTTLAANISLNSGGQVEFGQATAVTVGCAGSSNLTLTPRSSFVNASGAGAYYLSSVTVTGIPNSCYGKDFQISAFDNNAGTSALPIFNGTKTTATVYNNAGTFQQGFQSNGTTVSSTSGGFTVTFSTPVALASNVVKLTLQSTEHVDWNCIDGGPCTVGQTGPGGGVVFFVGANFSCGPTASSTCNTLEVAPASWNGAESASGPWASASRTSTQMNGVGGMINDSGSYDLASFGRGYLNTINIISRDSGLTMAAQRAQSYRGGNLADWYLPNVAEINALCRYAKEIAPAFTACGGSVLDGKARGESIGIGGQYWTSSEIMFANGASFVIRNESQVESQGKGQNHLIRPIRAF